MRIRVFLFIFFLMTVNGFAKPVRVRNLSRFYEIKVVYHLDRRWVGFKKNQKEIKLFLDLPYIVSDGYFYRLSAKPSYGTNGELLVSEKTSVKLLELLGVLRKQKPRLTGKVSSQHSEISKITQNVSSQTVSSIRIADEHFLISKDKSFSSKRSRSSSRSSEHSKSSVISEKKQSSSVARTTARINFKPINAVVLDPGHGGKDPGGLGVHGEKEKEIVLSVAKKVYARFRKDGSIKAVLTRHKDVFVTLKGRTLRTVDLMKRYNPIFVSMHANISFNHKTQGIEIYHYGNVSSKDQSDRYVANWENSPFDKKDIRETEALFVILNDLIRDGVIAESAVLGNILMRNMVRKMRAKNRGVRQAHFYVLKYNPVPSVLIEMGFLSNSKEAKKLMTPLYQDKISEGIYLGIKEFIDKYNQSRGVLK